MRVIHSKLVGTPFNIALIVSRYNQEITQKLYEGALQRLRELGVSEDQISVVWVPTATEIPLVAQRLAKLEYYEVIIALGSVIRGETDHYDYVCQQVSQGCQKVALDNNIPVIFGVLTTETEEQALERVGGSLGHKGRDAVDAAVEMVAVLRQI